MYIIEWRNAKGTRIRHRDIWQRMLRLLRCFEIAPDRRVEIMHVRAHVGVLGNERADKLAKEGSKLRFELMEAAAPVDWFHSALYEYWGNRETE